MDPETATRPSGSGITAKLSIASQYALCKNAFNNLLENVGKSDDDHAVAQRISNEFGRFRVWAGNAGAHRTGRVSLDHRLRDASHIYEELSKLLGELKKDLDDGEFY